jgi:hypothetical protein
MSMDAEIKVFAKTKVGRTDKKRYVQVMSSEDDGNYDVGGPVLPCFLKGYVNNQKGFGYGPVEITKEEIQEYTRLSRKVAEKMVQVLQPNERGYISFRDIDMDNKAHKDFFDEICKMFFIQDRSLEYFTSMLYKLDHIVEDLELFEDILRCIDAHEKAEEDPYVILEYS